MEINVSFLKSKSDLSTTLLDLDKTSCDTIHVDFMDGTFVDNKSVSIEDMMDLKSISKRKEIHVMVNDPLFYLEKFVEFNPSYYIFSYEAVSNHIEIIKKIVSLGIRPGIAISPDTSIEEIKPLLRYIDTILVMSVYPGLGGQKFLDSTIPKIMKLRSLYKGRIEVDGGINNTTISFVKDYCDAVVSGSYICMSLDYEEKVQELKKIVK